MACKLSRNTVISDSVTVTPIDGVPTVVIDIPDGTYYNGWRYNIIVAQNIPVTATIVSPVAISIGGDTTTVYPLVRSCSCEQVSACAIRGRTLYPTVVSTSTTGGVFKVLNGLSCCYPNNDLESIPVSTTTSDTQNTTKEVNTNG